jgi:Rrf2 family protein
MGVSQKCQYALRAVYELASRGSAEPVRIADLAKAQAIPARFLEVIMAQLKQAGVVASRRGNEGGYLLGRPASEITVGKLIRFIDGPTHP